jgi:polyhydroxyalkanoate synthesis regulator phasin
MTQPKRSSSSNKSSSSSNRSAAAKKAAATRKSQANKRSAAAKKGAATRKQAAAKKSGAQAKTQAKRTTTQAKSGTQAAAAGATESVTAAISAFRDAVTARAADPLNVLMITRDRLQETLDNAVERGHMTREAANGLASDLAERGLKEWQDVLSDMDQLIGRVKGSSAADVALQQVDRARRAVGVGPSFPISNYDDLTAAQVSDRLGGLTPAELRKVRDYERRHGNRKSVLNNIEKQLA